MMYTYMYSIMSYIGQIGQSNTAGIRHVSRTKFKSNAVVKHQEMFVVYKAFKSSTTLPLFSNIPGNKVQCMFLLYVVSEEAQSLKGKHSSPWYIWLGLQGSYPRVQP